MTQSLILLWFTDAVDLIPLYNSCSAFNGAALATQARSSSAMKMTFESEIGAQPPIGFWDPLGLVADADQERFDRLRYVEIKHGRIAMLAVLGHITQQNYRLPGETTFIGRFCRECHM